MLLLKDNVNKGRKMIIKDIVNLFKLIMLCDLL
jgi:hypothetical protein